MDDQFLRRVDDLSAAGHARELDFAPVVARIAVDRFNAIARPNALDVARFVKILRDTLDTTDAAAAGRIAAALADNPDAPPQAIALLMAKGPAATTALLRCAARLPRATLLSVAETGAPADARAVAMRTDLDQQVVAALARRLEQDVLHALASNTSLRIDRGALIVLAQRGRVDSELGRALLARENLGALGFQLFLSADGRMRRRLMAEAQTAALAAPAAPSILTQARAAALRAAMASDHKGFAAAIAQQAKTGRAMIDRMIADVGGEPLGLLLAAMELAPHARLEVFRALRPEVLGAAGDLPEGVRLAVAMTPAAANALAAAITGRSLTPASTDASEYRTPNIEETSASRTLDRRDAGSRETQTGFRRG